VGGNDGRGGAGHLDIAILGEQGFNLVAAVRATGQRVAFPPGRLAAVRDAPAAAKARLAWRQGKVSALALKN
jgi:hypothetical protein